MNMYEYLIEIVLVNGNLKIHQAFIQRRLYFDCSQFFVGIDSGIGNRENGNRSSNTRKGCIFSLFYELNVTTVQY